MLALLLFSFLLLLSDVCLAEDKNVKRNGGGIQRKHHTSHTTSSPKFSTLSDVWLCLLCGLGWTVWIVAAYSKPSKLTQISEYSIPIYGNVLQTTIVPSMSGIPSYKAVIDYKLNDLQVRKTFTTNTQLEQGFANVELLVLPDDYHSAVLKTEWEKEFQDYQEQTEAREKSQFVMLCFGGLLVLLTLIGASLAVSRLPVNLEFYGWLSIVVSMTAMWPAAIGLYGLGSRFVDSVFQTNQQKGVLVNVAGGTLSTNSTMVTTPKASNRMNLQELWQKTREEGIIPASTTDGGDTTTTHAGAGCYIINLPLRMPSWRKQARTQSEQTKESSVSTLSGSFQGSRDRLESSELKPKTNKDRSDGGGLELPSLLHGFGKGTLV